MKILFWNTDTQYDFMRNDKEHQGLLYIKNAETIEPELQELTNLATHHNIQVVNTADWHNEQTPELSKNPNYTTTFPPHCMQHTKGATFIPATQPTNPYIIDWQQPTIDEERIKTTRNIIIYKDQFNSFTGNPHTARILEIINPDIIITYGVALNVCVNYAVLEQLKRRKKVYVPTNATKELPNIPITPILDGWTGAFLTSTPALERIIRDNT